MKGQLMKVSKKHKLILSVIMFFMTTACAYSYPPGNASVLYYKVAMSYDVDGEMSEILADLSKDKIEVNDEIRQHVKDNRLIINTVLDATEIKNCDWGFDISEGLAMKLPLLS